MWLKLLLVLYAIATSYQDDTTPTTVNMDPDTFCTSEGRTGIYKNPNDPTCKTFIYCVKLGDAKVGYVYNCSENTPYFYENTCQIEKPSECSSDDDTLPGNKPEQTNPTDTPINIESENTDPYTLCTRMDQSGSFKNQNDPTCKTFIYCSKNGNDGTMRANIYQCSQKKPYFSGEACQAEKPADCI